MAAVGSSSSSLALATALSPSSPVASPANPGSGAVWRAYESFNFLARVLNMSLSNTHYQKRLGDVINELLETRNVWPYKDPDMGMEAFAESTREAGNFILARNSDVATEGHF